MPSFRQPGTVFTDHFFEVPLDHAAPDGEQITVFAREMVAVEHSGRENLPWLLYLQGGPGRPSPRPVSRKLGWLDRALRDYRLLLLDQRGTGRSTPAGGFCTVTYLSKAPEGLAEAFIAGGLPGLATTAEDVYRATYQIVTAKNEAHYGRYPDDIERAQRIARHLARRDVRLPSGAPLTVRAFQALGLQLGTSTGSHLLHYLLGDAFDGGEIGDDFAYRALPLLTFAAGPLFGALHEACYGQSAATRWAAQRIRAEFPAFDIDPAPGGEPLMFTGEMIYPWMFQADPVLRPLAEVAGILADHEDWPPLYDQTAARIRGLRSWITSEYEHDGLSASRDRVLDRLIGMVRGTI